jgi:hypothetical protein
VSDRSADRSIGVWANNVDQRLNLGVASSNAGAYFAWQDTRNANPDFQPEDVYMASVVLDGDAAAAADDSGGAPTWLLAATGLALGMGLAMAVVWLRARRPAGTAPAPA